MQAHQLKPPRGAKHAKKRIGRGNAAGQGTYSGRGLKGQKARAGNKPRRFFEGGQTRLFKKLPFRRGFRNPFRVEYQPVNLDDLERFDDGAEVTPEALKEKGILRSIRLPVKILASGGLTKKLNVTAHRFSLAAKEKIEAAGGSVVETSERKSKSERKYKKKDSAAKAPAAPKPEAKAEDEAAPATETEPGSGDGDNEPEDEGNGSGG
jgi:large subunit ribosomal protein L15